MLPGVGLSRLRVTRRITNFDLFSQTMLDTDLPFLSSLECPGISLSIQGLTLLSSLKGPERVVPIYSYPFVVLSMHYSGCVFSTNTTTALTDVSALAAYVRCGANQRPDSDSINYM